MIEIMVSRSLSIKDVRILRAGSKVAGLRVAKSCCGRFG
jgi:hypothetical protein